jgi:hypothetical protein
MQREYEREYVDRTKPKDKIGVKDSGLKFPWIIDYVGV